MPEITKAKESGVLGASGYTGRGSWLRPACCAIRAVELALLTRRPGRAGQGDGWTFFSRNSRRSVCPKLVQIESIDWSGAGPLISCSARCPMGPPRR